MSKLTECTPYVNYRLWVTKMYQCMIVNCKKCTPLVRDVESRGGCACLGTGVYGKPTNLLSFAVNLKPL